MTSQLHMQVTTCPFCGVVTDVPHNTQEGCIEALHAEIEKMRRLLDQVQPVGASPSPQKPTAREDPESEKA